jgi:hypothetical protein
MLRIRSRDGYKYFKVKRSDLDSVLAWKKGQGEFPQDLFDEACEAIGRYFQGFDCITVPAPSFHSYAKGGYPMAKRLQVECGFTLRKLFPDHSGKTKMHYAGNFQKEVQDIRLGSGLFVLVLDDVSTTGLTMKVTYEAILRKGSFPCGLTLA